MRPIIIAGVGHSVPDPYESNEVVESELGLPESWIERRTGIRRRHVVDPSQATSDLAIAAGKMALQSADSAAGSLTPSEGRTDASVKALILATSTPDHLLPPTAPYVAAKLELRQIPAFDMAVACSGFVYGVVVAESLARQLDGPVLLIAANVLSKRVDPLDRNTRALFADAAGAVLLQPRNEAARTGTQDHSPKQKLANRGILTSHLESSGEDWAHLMIPAGGSKEPITRESFERGRHTMRINDGPAAFRYAVEKMSETGQRVLDSAGVSIDQVRWWIPHQANRRIIDEAAKKLHAKPEQTAIVLDRFGNSSAATIPLTLSHLFQEGDLRHGDLILLTAAGAGLTAGAVLIRY